MCCHTIHRQIEFATDVVQAVSSSSIAPACRIASQQDDTQPSIHPARPNRDAIETRTAAIIVS